MGPVSESKNRESGENSPRVRRPPRNSGSLRNSQKRSNELTNSQRRTSTRRSADFDIDNVVLPMSGTIRTIEYKEIETPHFRLVDKKQPVEPMDDSSEDTDIEKYKILHEAGEVKEKNRFVPVPTLQKKNSENALSTTTS